ncbi:MAG: acyl-ACP--UDP-N-acetylglucosamine O-acyltransferase [Kiritimatiellae bacterium]|nr:acyl-ACP--UDP-N-acetylglucosamine O-acyltransferase [Kiritimatiellia bacterium]
MSNIHPTAIIAPGAQLAEDVQVGAYAMIGPHVKIGAGTVIRQHANIEGHTTLGEQCEVFPFACIGMKCQDLKYVDGDITYAEVGDRTVLREYTTVHLGTKPGEITKVGADCLIMAYCHIAHGCTVGEHVIISNLGTLAGEVLVEDYAILGGLVAVHQFCRIGAHSMIAGGSKVRQDCAPFMLTDASNEDAKVLGPNIVGLKRRGYGPEVRIALKEAYRLLYREGLNRTQALDKIKYEMNETPEITRLVEFYQTSHRGVL